VMALKETFVEVFEYIIYFRLSKITFNSNPN
jgi:hypothetical protein